MNKYTLRAGISILIVGFLVALASIIPSSQYHIISLGIDSYNTHRLLFGKNEFAQDFIAERPLQGIGFIFSNIRHAPAVSDVLVTIENAETGDVLAHGTIPGGSVRDDTFAVARFDTTLPQTTTTLRVRIQAPQATIETPIGVRFDPDPYPGIIRYENNKPQSGIFAMELREQVPLSTSIHTFILNNAKPLRLFSIIVGALAALFIAMWLGSLRSTYQTWIRWGVVTFVACIAFGFHIYTEQYMGGVSGGDPYNYLQIAEEIHHLRNPFAAGKRLPGYPLLLVPAVAYPSIDAHSYMRILSSLAAAGCLIATYALTRTLKLPWAVGIGSVFLLAFQKDFFATSLRPEPYTLYALLLVTALYLFFSATTVRRQLLFSFVLGYAAMTRQEGFVLAALLGIVFIFVQSRAWHVKTKTPKEITVIASRMFLPALIIVVPFFIHNAITFGNPLYTPYFKGEKLEIVDSYRAFSDASIATWSIMSSLWKPSWTQLQEIRPYDSLFVPLALFGLLALGLWGYRNSMRAGKFFTAIMCSGFAIGTVYGIWLSSTDPLRAAKYMPILITGMTIASLILFLLRSGLRGLIVGLVLASQILIALWFHPYPKHYQQSYPLIAIMLSAALFPAISGRLLRISTYSVVALPFIVAGSLLFTHIEQFIDAHNAASALDSVIYRAVRTAREYPGPYGVEGLTLPALLYLPFDGVIDLTSSDTPPDNVRTFIEVNEISSSGDSVTNWDTVATYKSEGKDEVLYVSRVLIHP